MNRKWDAIVVGAGPAGSTLAGRLSRRGWRVLLVDAARFPRQKVCGEYLSAAAGAMLADVGLDAAVRHAAVPLQTLRLVLPGGQSIETPFEGPADQRPSSLSRYQFDDLLVQHAVAGGAQLCEGYRVRQVRVDQGRAVGIEAVSTDHRPAPLELAADLLIAADGRRSVVVRETGSVTSRRRRLVGFKQHVRGGAGSPGSGVLEMHSLPGGYLGISPVEDGAWNVCGVLPRRFVKQARGSMDDAWRLWAGKRGPLGRFLSEAKPLGPWLTIPEVATQIARPRVSQVLYVGDACGTIEPLAGQGMTMALAGAALADDCLRSYETTEAGAAAAPDQALGEYFAAWQHAFGGRIRRADWLAGLLRRPRLLSALVPLDRLAHRLAAAIVAQSYQAISVSPK